MRMGRWFRKHRRPEWGTRRWVQFRPTDPNVKPVALPWVNGDPFEVEFTGTMDKGRYDGEPMWVSVDPDAMPGVAWIPDCDLVDVERPA